MKNIILLLSTLILFCSCAKKTQNLVFKIAEKKEQFYSNKKAKSINMSELIDEISQYQVIFVGDHHNSILTHKFFNSVLENMAKKGYTLHLANEWFSASQNKLLRKYTNGELTSKELKEKIQWGKNTSYKWEIVKPLYETIKTAKGRLYGINILKEKRKRISQKDIKNMSPSEKDFYKALDLNVFAHKTMVKPFFNHCLSKNQTETCEERMYRVQVAWDTYMAIQSDILARKVLKSKKDKLFIFAGSIHIEQDLGIPLRFARLNNTTFTSISNYKISKEEEILIPINKTDILYL